MSYLQRADYVLAFGALELSQRLDRNFNGAEEVGVLEQAITLAASDIDRKLAGRFFVPFDPLPPLLKPVALALCRYYLWQSGENLLNEEHIVYLNYRRALKELEFLAEGKGGLEPPRTGRGGGVSVAAPEAVFSSDVRRRML